MATSTALRFRNRSQPNPVVVSDALAGLQSNVARILSDSIAINDNEIVTYRRLTYGDRLTLFSDSSEQGGVSARNLIETIAVSDDIDPIRSTRKILLDLVLGTTDEGFITDKDYLRNRLTSDSIAVTDSFQKIITVADFQIISRIISESIEVTDNTLITVGGIIQRTLSDSIAVSDLEELEYRKEFVDALDSSDSVEILRYVNRKDSESISVTDDTIVSRTAIINTKSISDSLSVVDRKTANSVAYTVKSAKIKHGIEAQ